MLTTLIKKRIPQLSFIVSVVSNFVIFGFIIQSTSSYANTPPIGETLPRLLIVDQKATTGFTTIQEAIDASSRDKTAIILIKPGIYREKLFITRNNLSLVGTSKENTIIEFAELRNNWRENHESDWGAAVINISGSDITIINLSVINNYGRKHNTSEHQFAIRGFENATRIILDNCTVIADGADTLSLWNKTDGMYYHSNCHFEGYTDMVCPRGTALIEHSSFYNHGETATLWHDGELDQEQKLVVNNSSFDGVNGFWLGRHHYDAQFYLLNSSYSKNLANKPIFRKTYPENPNKNRPNLYGNRVYFENSKSAPTYPWLKNNFSLSNITAQKKQANDDSLEQWVFNGKWAPNETLQALKLHLQSQNFL